MGNKRKEDEDPFGDVAALRKADERARWGETPAFRVPDIVIQEEGRHPADVIQDLQSEIRRVLSGIVDATGITPRRINGAIGGGRPSTLGHIVNAAGEPGCILWKRETGEIRTVPKGGHWAEGRVDKNIPMCRDFWEAMLVVKEKWKDPKYGLIPSFSAAKTRRSVDDSQHPLVLLAKGLDRNRKPIRSKKDNRICDIVWLSGNRGCYCRSHQYLIGPEGACREYVDPLHIDGEPQDEGV